MDECECETLSEKRFEEFTPHVERGWVIVRWKGYRIAELSMEVLFINL